MVTVAGKFVRTPDNNDRQASTMYQKPHTLLCQSVSDALRQYLKDLNGEEPVNLHSMVISEAEKPLLELVMEQARSNQSRAAKMLGINRNTLRKKLNFYNLE